MFTQVTKVIVLGLAMIALLGASGIRQVPAPAKVIVSFPIEVMGPAGTYKQVRIDVPEGQASTVTAIYAVLHNASYSDKISVQVNSHAYKALSNTSVTVYPAELSYGGIGGDWSTIRVKIPLVAGTVVDGSNFVKWRFNFTDGKSSGFRVVYFNFIRSDDSEVVTSDHFVNIDPAGETSFFKDAVNIARGEQLWKKGILLNSPLVHTAIRVSCGDCHARDAADLKYFGYTNYSIEARCMFHGMSLLQARQVSSYVRKNKAPVYGRPWNPPYQPGPGLDSLPVAKWAAGAGWEAVLDNDLDMLPVILPASPVLAVTQTLNLRETRIPLQLLDWNHWLPTTHPRDAFGDDFINSKLNYRYSGEGTGNPGYGKAMLPTLLSTDSINYIKTRLINDLSDWVSTLRPQYINPLTSGNITWTRSHSEKVYSVGQWMAVKTWELTREFDLESYGHTVLGSSSENRTWFNGIPEQISPARMNTPLSVDGVGGSIRASEYTTNAWDEIQLIVNANRTVKTKFTPDWGYLFSHQIDMPRRTNRREYGRYVAAFIKGMQQRDNGLGVDADGGWQPAHNAPLSHLIHNVWDGVSSSVKKAAIDKLLAAWLDKSDDYTPVQWYANGQASATQVPGVNLVSSRLVDQVWTAIPEFRAISVDSALIDRLKAWAATIWPNSDWANR